jgi:hypothetical protein
MANETEDAPNTQISAKLPASARLFNKFAEPIAQTVKRFSLRTQLSQLTVSQWFYFAAFIVFLVLIQDDEDYFENSVIWVGVLAGIGLVRELWFLFNKVWDKTYGKGIVILLYAATANLALAVAAMKINAITGIEPHQFVFTLAFSTLIMLPFWLFTASILFFSIALVALNVWLVISILLRIVRIKVKVHWEDQSFVFITMILRLVLIPSIVVSLSMVIAPYAEQLEFVKSHTRSETIQTLKDEIEANSEDEALGSKPIFYISTGDGNTTPNNDEAIETDEIKKPYLNIIIANFIYWFEAYPKSMCHKTEAQRSFILDENSVLLVEPDDSELGFVFSVAACKPLYLDAE